MYLYYWNATMFGSYNIGGNEIEALVVEEEEREYEKE
jgi:hypothetical protein